MIFLLHIFLKWEFDLNKVNSFEIPEIKRRREDSIEVQQMKEAAREEKDRRQAERNNLLREREARRIADQGSFFTGN